MGVDEQRELLREALKSLTEIASQKTAAELFECDEDEYEYADFEGGYSLLIERARAAADKIRAALTQEKQT